jgi:glycerate kinase
MAAALGVKFLDEAGKPVSLNGEGLAQLRRIDLSEKDPRIDQCQILVACDVDNPLYGENGAAYVFAPQKGADRAMVEYLDQNLQNYAAVLQKELGLSVQEIAGAGAAGGLGAGLVAFTPAQLKPGIEIILDAVQFGAVITDADLIVTGEGKIDGQSLRGKVPVGIADRAKDSGVPVIAIVGDVGDGLEAIYQRGITAVFSTNRVAVPFSEARFRAKEDLVDTSASIARLLKIAGW